MTLRLLAAAALMGAPASAATLRAAAELSAPVASVPAAPLGAAALAAPALSAAPLALSAAPAAFPLAAASAPVVVAPAAERPSAADNLRAAGAAAAAAPRSLDRLYDAAPAAPDFDALTPVRVPAAPSPWTPRAAALKPAAALVNAFHAAAHRRTVEKLGAAGRLTLDERSLREGLTSVHAALDDGRVQDAIGLTTSMFLSEYAHDYFRRNPRFLPYRDQALAYLRFAEGVGLAAYQRAGLRGREPELIAEARAAAGSEAALGRAWRPTSVQDADTSHCALHALYNAIAASVGFAQPTAPARFIAAARAALERSAEFEGSARDERLLSEKLGLRLRRSVDQGLSDRDLDEWTAALGLRRATQPAPRGDAGWSALFAPGRENMLTLRMFHPRYAHDLFERRAEGHDYRVLHHEVYLLGAFDSPSKGERLYLVQDSGSGATLMATAAELSALTRQVDAVDVGSAPVAAR